eukprot:1141906-Pelagomonas_calceolata.AAC.4
MSYSEAYKLCGKYECLQSPGRKQMEITKNIVRQSTEDAETQSSHAHSQCPLDSLHTHFTPRSCFQVPVPFCPGPLSS